MSGPVLDPRFHAPPRRVIALIVFAAAVFWFARPVILPFVVGALIAYAFSPYIDRAQARTGRSRFLIVALGFGAALVILGLLVLAFSGPVSREIGGANASAMRTTTSSPRPYSAATIRTRDRPVRAWTASMYGENA